MCCLPRSRLPVPSGVSSSMPCFHASSTAQRAAATRSTHRPGRHGGPLPPSACLQDEDEGIAVEACEFWTAFCESEIDKDVLRPFLPRVLPVLLKNMVRRAAAAGHGPLPLLVQPGGWSAAVAAHTVGNCMRRMCASLPMPARAPLSAMQMHMRTALLVAACAHAVVLGAVLHCRLAPPSMAVPPCADGAGVRGV